MYEPIKGQYFLFSLDNIETRVLRTLIRLFSGIVFRLDIFIFKITFHHDKSPFYTVDFVFFLIKFLLLESPLVLRNIVFFNGHVLSFVSANSHQRSIQNHQIMTRSSLVRVCKLGPSIGLDVIALKYLLILVYLIFFISSATITTIR